MWTLDFPDQDPDSNYPAPSVKQLIYRVQARTELRRLKSTLQRLTVPQQRSIIGELAGSIYKRCHASRRPSTPRRG